MIILISLVSAIPAFGQVVIEQLLLDPAGNESRNDTPEIIVILNRGESTQDLTDWTLSSTPPAEAPDVWAFPAGTMLQAGQRATIHWRAPQADQADILYTETGVTLLNNDGGDLALISPDGIEHYVQWGKAGQGIEEAAVAAGKWTAGDVVERPPEGEVLLYDGSGYSSGDWSLLEVPTVAEAISWGLVKARR